MKNRQGEEMAVVGKYRCERLAVYAGTSVKGTEKVLTVYKDPHYPDNFRVQVGGGEKLYFYHEWVEEMDCFWLDGGKPQRWDVIEKIA